MAITGTIRVQQRIESIVYADLAGKTVTLSWSVNNEVFSETFVAPVIAGHPVVFDKELSNCTLNWVKLERGNRATPIAALDPTKEWLRAKRYYNARQFRWRGAFGGSDVVILPIPRLVQVAESYTDSIVFTNFGGVDSVSIGQSTNRTVVGLHINAATGAAWGDFSATLTENARL